MLAVIVLSLHHQLAELYGKVWRRNIQDTYLHIHITQREIHPCLPKEGGIQLPLIYILREHIHFYTEKVYYNQKGGPTQKLPPVPIQKI